MKIFSPHRRKMEASRRFGSKEFQNKIKKAQGYKRVFDPRTHNIVSGFLKSIGLGSWWAKLLIIALLALPAYFLFISDYFVISTISASNNSQITNQQILSVFNARQNTSNFFIPKNHAVFLTRSRVEHMLVQAHPLIKELNEFRFVWPNQIEFTVVERQPGFAFSAQNKKYLVDDQGLIIKQIDDLQGLVLVINQTDETVEPGEQLNNSKLVGFVLSMIRQWPTKINSQIKEARVPGKASGQIQFVSSEGWGVFFDVNYPVESQLANLSLILSRQIPAKDRLNLAYIDLRFDKWAYYCYKNQPCQAGPREEEGIEDEVESVNLEESGLEDAQL
jgi:cell division septal protein FtsQ